MRPSAWETKAWRTRRRVYDSPQGKNCYLRDSHAGGEIFLGDYVPGGSFMTRSGVFCPLGSAISLVSQRQPESPFTLISVCFKRWRIVTWKLVVLRLPHLREHRAPGTPQGQKKWPLCFRKVMRLWSPDSLAPGEPWGWGGVSGSPSNPAILSAHLAVIWGQGCCFTA